VDASRDSFRESLRRLLPARRPLGSDLQIAPVDPTRESPRRAFPVNPGG